MNNDNYDIAIESNLIKADKDGTIYKKNKNGDFKIVPLGKVANGSYRRVVIILDGKRVSLLAHRIIAKLFIPNPKNKPQVNHMDRNTINNNVSNLEWITPSDNVIHALEMDRHKKPNQIKDEDSELKKARLNKKLTQPEMAKMIGVSVNAYRNWEQGTSEPKEENLEKLKEILETKEDK